MTVNDLLRSLELGDHVCCPADSVRQQWQTAVAGTACGLARGQKVLFFVPDPDGLRRHLAAEVTGAARALERQQIMVNSSDGAYLSKRGFDGEQMLDLVAAEIDLAERQGFTGLRATGDLSAVARQPRHTEAVLDYEVRLASIYAGGRITGICHYDPGALAERTWQRVVAAHPSTVQATGQGAVSRLHAVRTPVGIRVSGGVGLVNRGAVASGLAEVAAHPGPCEIDATALGFADGWAVGCLLRTAGARAADGTTIVCSTFLSRALARCGAASVAGLTVLPGGAQ